MTNGDRTQAILDALDAALRGPLGVRKAESIEEFNAPGSHSRYLYKPELTLARHFDIEPAFLVLDPLLGTLGVVELVMPQKDDGTLVKTLVRRHVDRATYLRHLLLRDRTRGELRPLNVELVLLTTDPIGEEKSTLDAIGETLRSLVQDTDSLFHVGVGILCHTPSPAPAGQNVAPFDKRLRRAFPWLLTATRRWLRSARANPEEPRKSEEPEKARPPDERVLRRLTLKNYRLPGVRTINLADARVHLVHGANGSGKSSIAEALEIATCGTVERLVQSGAQRYDEVITHAPSSDPASVQLGWLNRTQNRFEEGDVRIIGAKGVEDPLDASIPVASFRLDQPLMDRLIGRYTHERAKIFMEAFFPEAVTSRATYEQAAAAHEQALGRVDAVVERLEAAKRGLVELKDHKTSGATPTAEPFPELLNKWLEHTAILDLLQRQRVIHATIKAAQQSGWSVADGTGGAVVSALAGASGLARLEQVEQLEKDAKATVDKLQSQLDSFTSTETKATGPAPLVSRATKDALNAVDSFLFPTDTTESERFGDKVAGVFNAGDAGTYGTATVIGSENWTEPLVKDLDRMIDATKSLRLDDATPPPWPGKNECPDYDDAVQTHASRLTAGRALSTNFLDKLRADDGLTGEFDGSLISALNEMMALMTPARWAYHDILLKENVAGGKVGMGMHLDTVTVRRADDRPADPVRAELHLNTAELNLFTVALFMLCVGRVKKPLNLLVFDDPLQNMDELTSTTLARGLAKIVRLWAELGRKEELLVLFHGYNALERFAAEIAAAGYRLPWLSPSQFPADVKVGPKEPGGDVLAVQKFTNMAPTASRRPNTDAKTTTGQSAS